MVYFKTNDDNENNDDISENTGFEHFLFESIIILLTIYISRYFYSIIMERPGDMDDNGYNNDDPLRCSGGQLISAIPHRYNIVKNIKDTQPKITSDSPSVIAALNYYVALAALEDAASADPYDAAEVDRLRQAADQAWKKLGTWHIDAESNAANARGAALERKYYAAIAAIEEGGRGDSTAQIERQRRIADIARRNLDPVRTAALDCALPNDDQMGGSGIIDMFKSVRGRSSSSKRKSSSSRRTRKTKSNRRGRGRGRGRYSRRLRR